jgi:hypothetical protein
MSNEVEFKDMSHAELKELAKDFELDVPGNASKVVLVEALDAYKIKAEALRNGEITEDEIVEDDEVIEEPTPKKTAAKGVSKYQKLMLQKADLTRKERVVVTDNNTAQTKETVRYVRWGNTGAIGVKVDIVRFGKPWYVRRGALANLRKAMITERTVNELGNTVDEILPRYTIQVLPGLTKEELELLANKQAIRNAGVA